jgi:hypothetical protein
MYKQKQQNAYGKAERLESYFSSSFLYAVCVVISQPSASAVRSQARFKITT